MEQSRHDSFLSLTVSLDVQLKRQKAVVSDGDSDGRNLNEGSRAGPEMEKIEQHSQIAQGRGQITADPVTG